MTDQERSIEPHWPYGDVAILKPANDEDAQYTAERTPIIRAVRTKEGYLLIVGELDRSTDVLLVDNDGYSAECRPWNDTLEVELKDAHRDECGRYLVNEITPMYLPGWGEQNKQ